MADEGIQSKTYDTVSLVLTLCKLKPFGMVFRYIFIWTVTYIHHYTVADFLNTSIIILILIV